MLKYIKDPTTDMHRDQAMVLFSLTKDQVDKKTTRDWSKNRFVFPQFYGSVYFQCAPNIWEAVIDETNKLPGTEITVKEHLKSKGISKLGDCDPKGKPLPGTFVYQVKLAEDDLWQNRFKVYARWKQDFWQDYLRDGGFSLYTGFRINGIYRKNEVTNYPVQGAAFHCLLWCLIRLQKWLKRHKMKTLIIGQIHDSMVLDIYPPELKDILAKVKKIMTEELLNHWKWIIVPLEVEAELAPINASWYEKKKVDL